MLQYKSPSFSEIPHSLFLPSSTQSLSLVAHSCTVNRTRPFIEEIHQDSKCSSLQLSPSQFLRPLPVPAPKSMMLLPSPRFLTDRSRQPPLLLPFLRFLTGRSRQPPLLHHRPPRILADTKETPRLPPSPKSLTDRFKLPQLSLSLALLPRRLAQPLLPV